ncbi:RDD family protein [Pseudonocardia xishanensis]|uniref:RDD domain-containing protein n=1 Tax=Pseudonocardia xishanensis TaxID=630995 RepID=A0ABP8RTK3_9PSEU
MIPPAARPRSTAGIVSRTLAAVTDLGVVLVLLGVVLLVAAGARFVVSPLSFHWPAPSWPLSVLVAGIVAVTYLALGWATVGRTVGDAVLGLRVLSRGGGHPGWVRSVLRAVLCVVFPLGLLWVLVSPWRRSLQDVVLRTTVTYDWDDAIGSPRDR